jgi:hypothetical protein
MIYKPAAHISPPAQSAPALTPGRYSYFHTESDSQNSK